MKFLYRIIWWLIFFSLAGCMPNVPDLPPMKADTGIVTENTQALADLNTILEVYIRPDFVDTLYYVKPITDATGISLSSGEIPTDITTLVREAISQVYYKIHHVEQYDQSDLIHYQVEDYMHTTQRIQRNQRDPSIYNKKPQADFTIAGNISEFDRALESTSKSTSMSGSIGGGQAYTSLSGSQGDTTRLSRITVSFNVYTPNGISVPGKFGASMEVYYAKDGTDIGFAIGGVGLGFGMEATAMHGRHLALQMLAEFSVAQIIGRTMGVPYWRACEEKKIFKEDPLVIGDWKEQFQNLKSKELLIPFMQAQCIACGDDSVAVTGSLDAATRAAFDRFADRFGVSDRRYPNFALYKALENNRLLDTGVAARAWAAYAAYKNGGTPIAPASDASLPAAADSAPSPAAVTPEPRPAPRPAVPAAREPAADLTAPLHDLF